MGDHRAAIDLKFQIHGTTYKQEWWINWFPDEDGVDPRIKDWFRESWEDAFERDRQTRIVHDRATECVEREERAELARLREKYEGMTGQGRMK